MSTPIPSPYADILDLINIAPVGDEAAVAAVRARDATLTKPPGSLGMLEALVEHLADAGQGRAERDNPMSRYARAIMGNRTGGPPSPRGTAQMVATSPRRRRDLAIVRERAQHSRIRTRARAAEAGDITPVMP